MDLMTRGRSVALALCSILLLAASAAAQSPAAPGALTVVRTGPEGPLATLAEAAEIRIVFSEPMVTLGRIPSPMTAPFVRIAPDIAGTFRWSGTTLLIFTPDPKQPLPHATTYTVTVDASATAVSTRRLARAVTFRFTTPTVKLLQTNWYRRGGTVAGNMVLLLRFNQPVRGRDIAAHLTAALSPHPFTPPSFTAEEEARLTAQNPAALTAFAAKVAAVQQVAASRQTVPLQLTTSWDQQRFPASPDLVAFEATAPVLPESVVTVSLGGRVPSPAGPATPGAPQSYDVEVEPAFFLDGFECRAQCNGDDRNALQSRSDITVSAFAAALRVTDITAATPLPVRKPAARPARGEYASDSGRYLTLEDAGFTAQPPNRKYAVSAPATLTAEDGQTLGYPWVNVIDNWHATAFTSFGDGHGVWEKDGGPQLPFYARNLRTITQWVFKLDPAQLMATLQHQRAHHFSLAPEGAGTARRLTVTPDRVQSHGLDVTPALTAGTGLVWAAVRDGDLLARTRRTTGGAAATRASLVQVTNLGITVKDSPQNTLVFVTRLDTGAPVAGAAVSIVRTDNQTFWRGTTGADGVAMAPETPLRSPENWYEFAFIVTAEKDGDLAYVGSDWNEGILPWDFNTDVNLYERDPLLRGSVFTDRGVYKLGETVTFKTILRQNTPAGVRLLPEGTPVLISVRDGQNKLVDERTVPLSGWSSAEWTFVLPAEGTLGDYSVRAILEADRPKPPTPAARAPGAEPGPEEDDFVRYERTVNGSFLVAAYRRPDFRVDVTLTGPGALAGDPLNGVVTGRYLFGAAMGAKPVTWRYSKTPGFGAPDVITDKYGAERWLFVGQTSRQGEYRGRADLRSDAGTLAATGTLPLTLDTEREAGIPYIYSLEGDVEDVSRQHIANRASLTVHPAPWYIGVRRPSYFLEQKAGLATEIVAIGLDGTPAAGVPVDVTLTQVQYTSVRRAEGNGFYTWDTQRREVAAGSWSVTTGAEPVPLAIPFASGGYFMLEARGRGDDGRFAMTRTSFYVLGEGYTAWERFDHNRIELVPERQTYRPGDTARIMIQSPWEQATALVTTEREGVRSHRQFALTSTQQSISVPITEDDIPNVFVSVLLVKGRTNAAPTNASAAAASADTSDPGKPSFRLGYVELNVEDRAKRLTVTVTPDRAGVPAGVEGHRARGCERRDRGRRRQRSDALGGGLRRAVTDRLSAARLVGLGLRAQVAAGVQRRQPPAHRGPPRAHAQGRQRGRGRRRGCRGRHAAQGFPRAGVLGGLGRDRRGWPRQRRPHVARIAHHLPHHGGGRRPALAVRVGQRRGAHQQARHAHLGLPTLPRGRRSGALRRRGRQPAAGRWHRYRHHEVARPGGVHPHESGGAAGHGRRRQHCGGALLGRRQERGARAHPDDGAARHRNRRLRGRAAGRDSGVAGNGGRLRRGGGRHDQRARDGHGAHRRRARLRRPRRAALVHRHGGPGRGRALSRGVPLRLRRAEGVVVARAGAGGRPWRRVRPARHGPGRDAPGGAAQR